MRFFRKLRSLFRRRLLDTEMAEEMRFHREARADRIVEDGGRMTEAGMEARRRFGHEDGFKEESRENRGAVRLELLGRDVAHAFRVLLKSRRSTAMIVTALSLGIGLATVEFSVVQAIRGGLPFEKPRELVRIEALDKKGATLDISFAEFASWREGRSSFSDIGAYAMIPAELSAEDAGTRTVAAAAMSAGLLELFRVRPILGRGFTPDDERPGAPSVVLLRETLWEANFDRDPGVIGRTVKFKGQPATIVGILPATFGFPAHEVAWTNLRPETVESLVLIGRLRSASATEQARAEFDLLVRQAETGASQTGGASRAAIIPTGNGTQSRAGVAALFLMGGGLGVLGLACLNVANLLAVRGIERGPEFAMRSALGASRGRLMQQMLVESLVVALLGAAGGGLVAVAGIPLVDRIFAGVSDKPFWLVFHFDRAVLAFVAAVSVLAAVLAGFLPALRASRAGAGELVRANVTAGGVRRLGRANNALVVAQLAISSALLIVTGVLINAAWTASRPGLAFDADSAAAVQVRLTAAKYATPAARRDFFRELEARLRALPGVIQVAMTDRYPVDRGNLYLDTEIEGQGLAGFNVMFDQISAGFFREMEIPVRQGVEFGKPAALGEPATAVINESFARLGWPGSSPVGKRFRQLRKAGPDPWITVAGVVADLASDRAGRGSAFFHTSFFQNPPSEALIHVRGNVGVAALARPIQEAIRQLDPDVPIDRVTSLGERLAERYGPLGAFSSLALMLGVAALVLAAVGVYGIASHGVLRRTREFGIRTALGAQPRDLLFAALKPSLIQLALGLSLGLLLGYAAGRPLEQTVSGSPLVLGGFVYSAIAALLVLSVGLAVWFPARRAARIDPMAALRAE